MGKSRFIYLVPIIFFIGGFYMIKMSAQNNNSFFSKGYEEVLTNSGLKILFVEDQSLPFVQYRIMFSTAGADYVFDQKKSGLSELTSYLLEQGAGDLDSEALQEELNQLGTSLGVSVGRQTMSIGLSGLSWHSEKLWKIFWKVITEPQFKEQEMEILRKQFIDERLKQLDHPSFVVSNVWRQKLFKDSLTEPSGGTLSSLSNISLEDIKTFYKNQILTSKAVLTVVGQFDKNLKQKIISASNEKFSKQRKEIEKDFSSSSQEAQFTFLTKKDLLQAQVLLGYPSMAFPVNDPRKYLGLKIANSILGSGGMDTRLFQSVREKKGLTYGIYSSMSFNKLYGQFIVSGSTKTVSVKEYLEETLKVLKTFREEGITLEELEKSKKLLRTNYLKSIETPEDRLGLLVYYRDYLGVDPNFLNNYLTYLEDLELEEVNSLIKEFILSKALHLVIYGDPSIQSQLAELKGFPKMETISFEDYFKEELTFKSQ